MFDNQSEIANIAGLMHTTNLTEKLHVRALELGFDLVGVAPAGPAPHSIALTRWLAQGYHGEMAYLARPDAVAARLDTRQRLSDARSLVILGVAHPVHAPLSAQMSDPARGRIASFAWGLDYHELLKPRIFALDAWLRSQTGRITPGKVSVDSAPVLERAWAQQAGLGFIGKNACLIHPRAGSWLLLATLLTPDALAPTPPPVSAADLAHTAPVVLAAPAPEPDQPPALRAPVWQFADGARGGCGGCTRCLTACPTQAFDAPGVLDARRCISYLTIELKGAIPRPLRPLLGNWVFGCDVCQMVCPWNGRRRQAHEERASALFAPRLDDAAPPLLDLVELDPAAFRTRWRKSPLLRAGWRGLLRNVCVALGNWGDPQAIPALARHLDGSEPLVRSHAAWALGRIGGAESRHNLARRLRQETDAEVRAEITLALDNAP